jgi:putative transposase
MGDTGESPEKVVAQRHQEVQLPACSNALAETINGLYKAELIHRCAPWKTKEAVELATLEWVSWFNSHRLLEPIGYIPPAEAEANYYRQLASQIATPV